jgi:hypothetical protein
MSQTEDALLKDMVFHIRHLDKEGNPAIKKYRITEKERYRLAGDRFVCGNEFLGGGVHAMTLYIRSKCAPPNTVTEAMKFLSEGIKQGSLNSINHYTFLKQGRRSAWHLSDEDYVPPPKKTWEEMQKDQEEMIAEFDRVEKNGWEEKPFDFSDYLT